MVVLKERLLPMAAVIVDPGIPGDMEHPGLEPALVPKCLSVLEDAEKNILDQIVGNRLASRHPKEEIEERSMMPVEQNAQSGRIPVSHGQHEVLVGFAHSFLETAAGEEGYRKFSQSEAMEVRRLEEQTPAGGSIPFGRVLFEQGTVAGM